MRRLLSRWSMNFGGLALSTAKTSRSNGTLDPRIDLIPELAAELVKAHVDVIYVGGDVANRAAQHATATIPILGVTEDMVGSGQVNSLARPGGNTTGVSFLATELNGKRQEILIEAVPGIRRIAAVAHSKETGWR
jgi:putative tryptophan/tyrosine transport system substrate-binding protein